MRRALAALLCGALAFDAAQIALAAPEPTQKTETDARARELFKQGDQAYAEGRYEDALTAFRQAYELSKRPLLLFNIGNTLERLGRWQEAADALEQYAPYAKREDRDAVEKRVENLKRRVAEREKSGASEKPEDTDPTVEEKPKAKPVVTADTESQTPILGWVLVGAGGAAIATGAVLGIMALSARGEADDGCKEDGGQRLCNASAEDAIERDKHLSLFADVALGVGVIAAGVGGYILLTTPKKAERTAIGARTRPGGGEIQLVGRF